MQSLILTNDHYIDIALCVDIDGHLTYPDQANIEEIMHVKTSSLPGAFPKWVLF